MPHNHNSGLLVEAMRKGDWLILDELNLAPTSVLEALNRVLDDNRELYITETQTLVKAHPNFVLFATQNPAGLLIIPNSLECTRVRHILEFMQRIIIVAAPSHVRKIQLRMQNEDWCM